jgi:hypothetical protein
MVLKSYVKLLLESILDKLKMHIFKPRATTKKNKNKEVNEEQM